MFKMQVSINRILNYEYYQYNVISVIPLTRLAFTAKRSEVLFYIYYQCYKIYISFDSGTRYGKGYFYNKE